MPVTKFKTLEDAERALWLSADDPRLPGKIRFVWGFGWELAGRYVPPRGVFKFRTIEEANAHRDAWEQDRINKIRERNRKAAKEAEKSRET